MAYERSDHHVFHPELDLRVGRINFPFDRHNYRIDHYQQNYHTPEQPLPQKTGTVLPAELILPYSELSNYAT
jgi:hypothetical protein